MGKFLMSAVMALMLTAAAFAGHYEEGGGEESGGEESGGEESAGVPEITLTTAASGLALLAGGSLLLADKLRRRKN